MPCPTLDEKRKILSYFAKKFQLTDEVCESIKYSLHGDMSGAEVENLCREAGMNVIRKIVENSVVV